MGVKMVGVSGERREREREREEEREGRKRRSSERSQPPIEVVWARQALRRLK